MYMSQQTRRVFMLQVAAGGAALGAGSAAVAQPARVDEKDAQAVALGYVHDTTKANKTKFPKHTPDQKCNNCQLYQGKATDPWGGCALFGAKQVAGPGWCSAWVKKP
jgi:hypothetical protein